MKKKIQQYGHSKIVRITPEEMEAYHWKLNDFVELSPTVPYIENRVHIEFKNLKDVNWNKLNEIIDKDVQDDFNGKSNGKSI